jgi:prophage regulatory protein
MPSKGNSNQLHKATAAISPDRQPDNLSIDRLPEVMRITGLSRPSIYSLKAHGKFPESIDLGPRAVGWIHAEVVEWVEDRIRLSRAEKVVGSRKLPKSLRERNESRANSAPALNAHALEPQETSP